MIRAISLAIPGLLATLSTIRAQQPLAVHSDPGMRIWGISGGSGNGYGGLGGKVDWYFAKSRLSLGIGGGYFITSNGGPRTGAAAAAIRAYTRGARHRGLLEVSTTLLSVNWRKTGNVFFDVHRNYGPGICGGYQFTAAKGFTFLLTGGAGWQQNRRKVWPIGDLGLGYTWRR